ncbi:hypothetical protein Daus18300_003971 [Diaporthe australafricana]|uniref:Uncharacterized protein n=1 Tax=Diaporthe australafricana TaxID=127596 RepID=A0ABR3XB24_9PEZI
MVSELSGAKRPDEDVARPANSPSVGEVETFEQKLARVKQESPTWGYIKDRLQNPKIAAKNPREQQAILQILTLPRLHELDDAFMAKNDKHQRRFNVNMGAILQVVGVEGVCAACPNNSRKISEEKARTCTGLPLGLDGPEYQELRDFVDSRCCHCIRSDYKSTTCAFTAGRPANLAGLVGEDIAGVDADPGVAGNSVVAHDAGANSNLALEIVRDFSAVALRARNQLQPEEQQGFADWVGSMASFSSTEPNLEGQFLALLARSHELPPNERANVRQWVLRFLPDLIGRPE